MQTYLGFPIPPLSRPVFLTIGVFDGVHRGHQALISEMIGVAHSAGCLAVLVTLDPHPLAVLRPKTPIAYLTTTDERAALLGALGLDAFVVARFTPQVAAQSAHDFMRSLVAQVPVHELWMGPDFALGRGRAGDAPRLQAIGQELGYTVRIVHRFAVEGEDVRSSRVRALLAAQGAVDRAARLLGRTYEVHGRPQPQTGRQPMPAGQTLARRPGQAVGVALPTDKLLPAAGLYAGWVWQDERGYPALISMESLMADDQEPAASQVLLLDPSASARLDLSGPDAGLGISFVERLHGDAPGPARAGWGMEDAEPQSARLRADIAAARRTLADPRDDADLPAVQAWEELRHTADWAVRVTGVSQRQLFARAAAVMFRLQGADPALPIALGRAITASGSDAADLLVAWLNGLLLGQELDGALYTRFEINEISDRGLRGVAYGYHGFPSHAAIKAVTYYDLDVSETDGVWTATVTFDV
ncbi:MAG: hypothetical protein FJ011_02235 [Chloroflexi bacterium]|nr:hypothetical protein [Chloroflexota bacterium]